MPQPKSLRRSETTLVCVSLLLLMGCGSPNDLPFTDEEEIPLEFISVESSHPLDDPQADRVLVLGPRQINLDSWAVEIEKELELRSANELLRQSELILKSLENLQAKELAKSKPNESHVQAIQRVRNRWMSLRDTFLRLCNSNP